MSGQSSSGSSRQAWKRRRNIAEKTLRRIMPRGDSPEGFIRPLANTLVSGRAARESECLVPLKHVRLQELVHGGLNCVDFRWWLCGELCARELQEFFDQYGSISLRSYEAETMNPLEPSPRLPVAYEQSDWQAVLDFCEMNNGEYHTLVNQALPLRDSLYAGNIVLLGQDHFLLFYGSGAITPRHVDCASAHELAIVLHSPGDDLPGALPPGVRELIAIAQQFDGERNVTLEWSIYPEPVGLLRSPFVFWEWRMTYAHDITRLLREVLQMGAESRSLECFVRNLKLA